MNRTKKQKRMGYEDLMREIASLEQALLSVDSSSAMTLMAIESRLRERFQQMEYRLLEKDPSYYKFLAGDEELSSEEIENLIPGELPPFPTFDNFEDTPPKKRKKTYETIGLAAMLAVVTALGVFGLASILHLALTWLA